MKPKKTAWQGTAYLVPASNLAGAQARLHVMASIALALAGSTKPKDEITTALSVSASVRANGVLAAKDAGLGMDMSTFDNTFILLG